VEVSSNFTLQPFFPREIAPCTHWLGDCAGPITGVVAAEKRKPVALPGIEPQFLGFIAGSLVRYRPIIYFKRKKIVSLGAYQKAGSGRGSIFTSLVILRRHH
jgi:hypothetical protein